MNSLNINSPEYELRAKAVVNQLKELYLPGISVNTVIFSYHKEKLNTLLLRFADSEYFMLSGGFILKNEDIDCAAKRNLSERSKLENIYLEQFYTSGETETNSDETISIFKEKLGDGMADFLINQRYIRVCYYALVDEDKLKPSTSDFMVNEYKWVDAFHLPNLLFNHNFIVDKAVVKLQNDLDRELVHVGKNLMNNTFTMAELQKLYEAVYQREFTRTNFQRKMLSLDILERLEKQYNGNSHKAPYLYQFK